MNIHEELNITEELLMRSSEEGGDWLRVLQGLCTDQRNRDMITMNNCDILRLVERFYAIHEKIHHRISLIRLATMNNPTNTEELRNISHLNDQFLEEQKEIMKIISVLKSTTFLGEMRIAWNTRKYMEFINQAIDDIFSNWALNDRGGLVYNPSKAKNIATSTN